LIAEHIQHPHVPRAGVIHLQAGVTAELTLLQAGAIAEAIHPLVVLLRGLLAVSHHQAAVQAHQVVVAAAAAAAEAAVAEDKFVE
jgi:hypothetical protein